MTGNLLPLFLLVAIITGIEVSAIIFVGRRWETRWLILLSIAAGWFSGIVCLCITAFSIVGLTHWVVPVILANIVLAAVAIACRPGGSAKSKALIVGYSLGRVSLGAAVLLTQGTVLGPTTELAIIYNTSSILLWPVLLTIMTLDGLWSWDDAFPKAVSRTQATES